MIDQLTAPPDADRVICAAAPGSSASIPPAGNAESVPVGVGVGCGGGEGRGDGEWEGGGALFLAGGGVFFLAGGGALVAVGDGTPRTAGGALVGVGAAFDVAGAGLRGATAVVRGCWDAGGVEGANDTAGPKAAGAFGSAVGVKR